VVARIRAAGEHVSVVESDDPHLLARAAYHLGNRHVALRIERGRLIYSKDHVLDGLCRELGLAVSEQILPFEPEAGGYAGGHGHAHERRLAPPSPGGADVG
jgi:urease accessory protein